MHLNIMNAGAILFVLLSSLLRVSAAQPPNILWIITDDQRADSIAAFNRMLTGKPESALGPVSSPRVDRLAAGGTTFINAYCQSAACAPSRAAMHAGRYPHHSGVYGFETHHAHHPVVYRATVPVVMARAGYQTSVGGKLGERTIGWDGEKWDWGEHQYDQYFAPFKIMAEAGLSDWRAGGVWEGGRETGRRQTFYFDDDRRLEVFTPKDGPRDETNQAAHDQARKELDLRYHYRADGSEQSMIIGGVSPRSAGHTRDGYYVKALKEFLLHPDATYRTPWGETLRGPDTKKPQFINLGFDFPHTPVLPPAVYRERFSRITYDIPQPEAAEIDAFPPQIRKLYRQKQSDHFTAEELQTMVRDYYAFCAYGDALVGEAVDAFRTYCQARQQPWLILYVCGDHGWRLNEHGCVSKFGPWGVDQHDPIIVVSSDKKTFPPGKVVKDFAEFVDMAPTFYTAAGLDLDGRAFEHLDGYDLASVAAGTVPARDYVLSEGWWVTGPRATIRTKHFMFSMKIKDSMKPGQDMGWALDKDLVEVEPLLYDREEDPGENVNLALKDRYRPIADAMRKKLQDIVLGDGRVEVDWGKGSTGQAFTTSFARGADDKKLELPKVEGAE